MVMATTSADHQYMVHATDKLNDVDAIYAAFKTAAELSAQVRDVVNKIAGASIQAPCNDPPLKEASQNGLLPSLGHEARDARADMENAIRDLRRLESQLP